MKYKEAKKIIKENLSKYRNYLNLSEWEVTILYMDENNPDNEFTGMMIETSIPYLRSTLKIFPAAYENQEEMEIKRMLVHELCHIITEPQYSLCRANVNPHLYDLVEEQREQETERIARIAQKGIGIA